MIAVKDQARSEVIAHYRARRDALIEEARELDASRRPLGAARKRHAARILSRAISDEVVDDKPTGLGTFDDVEAES